MPTIHGVVRGNVVQVANGDLRPFQGRRVIITIPEQDDAQENEKMRAFQSFLTLSAEIRKSLPENFDPQKELVEALDEKFGADDIVTRNISDYIHSEIPAIIPEDFLKLMER